jgi:hypothetical protein
MSFVIALALGFMALWTAAAPSAIDGGPAIGGHSSGDCCEYDSLGFCNHAEGGTCPLSEERDKCRKTTGVKTCYVYAPNVCTVDGCRAGFTEVCE